MAGAWNHWPQVCFCGITDHPRGSQVIPDHRHHHVLRLLGHELHHHHPHLFKILMLGVRGTQIWGYCWWMMWKSVQNVIIICEMCWIVTQPATCDPHPSSPSAAAPQVSEYSHGCIVASGSQFIKQSNRRIFHNKRWIKWWLRTGRQP